MPSATTKSRRTGSYEPSQETILIDTTVTAGFHWTDHPVLFTETVWNLAEVVTDPSGRLTAHNVREILFSLWCNLFNCSQDVIFFVMDTPIITAMGTDAEPVRLRVKVGRSSGTIRTFKIMHPDDYRWEENNVSIARLSLSVRWDDDRPAIPLRPVARPSKSGRRNVTTT